MNSRLLLTAALAVTSFPVFSAEPSPNRAQTLANLPLSFEPNNGQTDPSVRFVARSQGMTVFFADREVVMALHRRRPGDRKQPALEAAIRMKLIGANPPAEARGLELQSGVSNYFIGNDPKAWRAGVPHYGRIALTGVYDGIDLVSYGNQRQLEYDFVVAPGADPSQVQLAFDGVDSISVNKDGDLILETPLGGVIQKHPRVYQDSASGRIEVPAKYVISPGSHGVSFEISRYDRERPLVIDPVVSYSTYLGASGTEVAFGVAVDNTGAAYITGWTDSTNFPGATGMKIGSDDVFVTKLSPDGTSIVYSTYLGGTFNDYGNAIAVDHGGSAYVVGDTQSGSSFPQVGYIQSGFGGGNWDAFAVKLSFTGTVVYSTFIGGLDDDKAYGVAVDQSGYVYVAGYTYSLNFPGTATSARPVQGYQSYYNGGKDAFVVKIGPRGGFLAYSTYLGGTGEDEARGIAVDASGAAYITGSTYSATFPTPGGLYKSQGSTSGSDAFVTKLDPTGTSLVYSTCLGGASSDQGLGIAIDSTGAAYVTGTTMSSLFPTKAPLQASLNGTTDAFVTKLTPAGDALVYSTFLGGTGHETATGIAVDSTGAAYVAGYTDSTDFPLAGATQTKTGGSQDAFVANLNPAGSALVFSTYLGGSKVENANAIAVDALGAAFVVGNTESGDYPNTIGSLPPGSPADDNVFVAKFSGSLTPVGAKLYSPTLLGIIELPCCATSTELSFAWTAVSGAASYKLDVGLNCGGTDYFSQNVSTATSEPVEVPLGRLCARLTTLFDTYSVHYDYTYDVVSFTKLGGR